jgi:hypothetical protein
MLLVSHNKLLNFAKISEHLSLPTAIKANEAIWYKK